MNNDFKYIPYNEQDENIRGLIKDGNVYNMRRGLSGILLPDSYEGDLEELSRDLEYMKDMYPDSIKNLLKMVEEECDKLEYEDSPMLVEYPDRENMRKTAKKIYDRYIVEDEIAAAAMISDDLFFRPDKRPGRPGPPYVPENRNCRNCNLRNMIEILLCNEYFCRRDRYRRHRRRF